MATKGKKISDVAQDNLVATASGNELIPCAVNGQNGVITPDTIINHAKGTFVEKEDGKGLSTNDFTDTDKNQLYSGVIDAGRVSGFFSYDVRVFADTITSGTLGSNGAYISVPCRLLGTGTGLHDNVWKDIQSKGIDGQYINEGSIPTEAIADNAISGDKIAEGGISGYNIGLYQIGYEHLTSGTQTSLREFYVVTGSRLTLNGRKILDHSIDPSCLQWHSLDQYNIKTGGIVGANITGSTLYATNGITGGNINRSGITFWNMETNAVTGCTIYGEKIKANSIPATALSSGCVTGLAIANDVIDNTKMVNGYYPRITVSGGNISGAIPVDNVREAVESILTEHNLIPAQTE